MREKIGKVKQEVKDGFFLDSFLYYPVSLCLLFFFHFKRITPKERLKKSVPYLEGVRGSIRGVGFGLVFFPMSS